MKNGDKMSKLDVQIFDQTLHEVDKKIEEKKALEKPRHYLGMSQIGEECWRKLFYSFRNAEKRKQEAWLIKTAHDGYLQEDLMAYRLRMLPNIELVTNNSNTVNNILGLDIVSRETDRDQIGFKLLLDHFNGHIDGMIKGLVEAPQTWHVWENKTNEKKFNNLIKIRAEKGEKEALKEWNLTYYLQAQIYMHVTETTRHYLTVCAPGGRQYISIRTEYNRKQAESIIEKAKSIIFDNWSLPAKLSESREFWKCKFCEFQGICHDKDIPQIHCKTCRYREPVQNGENKCLRKDEIIKEEILNIGCNQHIFNPALIQAELIEHQQDCCLYKQGDIFFANCSVSGMPDLHMDKDIEIYSSVDLREKIKSVDNIISSVVKVQKAFNGTIKNIKKEKAWNTINSELKGL